MKLADDVVSISKIEEKISVYHTHCQCKLCFIKLLFALFMFQLYVLDCDIKYVSLWNMVKSLKATVLVNLDNSFHGSPRFF